MFLVDNPAKMKMIESFTKSAATAERLGLRTAFRKAWIKTWCHTNIQKLKETRRKLICLKN